MTRSLWPREHGAYGQLAVPLGVALASGRPGVAAIGLTAAALASFLAHEPALVLAGRRGARAQTENRRRAIRRLIVLGAVTALGATGVAHSVPVAVAAGVSVLLAIAVALLVRYRVEKTLGGELLAASALAAAAVPVAIASGGTPAWAAWTWLGWSLGFAAVTSAVHITFPRGTRRNGRAAQLAGAAAVVAAVVLGVVGSPARASGLPLVVAALALVVVAPPARRLRQVGWALMTATVTAGAWAIAAQLCA